ncbi:amino acid kinase family protein [Methanolobus halotolerans]|uniref:Amino acid kinase n=1 Tax=Methanolobus halotolerans TaxID=2052935 RepID=A0A4E0QQ67_9EURY|nr:amino acid kinase [Methanolobus halotolerans]TGC07036.1 amino acid kinase [Methanolobus halotolerans]
MKRVVVKLGGSLMEDAPAVIRSLSDNFGADIDQSVFSILIVPGGGPFADDVRSVSERYGIGDDAAHWMAILAMEQYAYYVVDRTGIGSTDSIEGIPVGVTMLFPYRVLKESDKLPHSWDVTSDTIAAWVARELNARFIKVTDVDGVYAEDVVQTWMTADEVLSMGPTCMDNTLPLLLKEYRMDCVIVNGKHPERVVDAVIGKDIVGTHIKGNI